MQVADQIKGSGRSARRRAGISRTGPKMIAFSATNDSKAATAVARFHKPSVPERYLVCSMEKRLCANAEPGALAAAGPQFVRAGPFRQGRKAACRDTGISRRRF